MCTRHQILHEGKNKARDHDSTQQLHTQLQLPMLKPTPIYVYLYHHIPFLYKIKAQLTTTYGRHTASKLSVTKLEWRIVLQQSTDHDVLLYVQLLIVTSSSLLKVVE